MPESIEQPKENPAYPTRNDFLELRRIADTKAMGTNIHEINRIMHIARALVKLAEIKGCDQERLKKFSECKTEIYEILSGTKTE